MAAQLIFGIGLFLYALFFFLLDISQGHGIFALRIV